MTGLGSEPLEGYGESVKPATPQLMMTLAICVFKVTRHASPYGSKFRERRGRDDFSLGGRGQDMGTRTVSYSGIVKERLESGVAHRGPVRIVKLDTNNSGL